MSTFVFSFIEHPVCVNLCACGHGPCPSSFMKHAVLHPDFHLVHYLFVLLQKQLTHLSFSSVPAVRAAIVHRGEWVYTRTKKLHYPPSLITVHAARKQPPCCSALSNCPHVLGRAEVGEILNCLSRNIRSTIRLAVPAHMALFFILGAHSGKQRRERSDEEWMRRKWHRDGGRAEGLVEREREMARQRKTARRERQRLKTRVARNE